MSKRLIIGLVVLVAAAGAGLYLSFREPAGNKALTDEELAEAARRLGRIAPAQTSTPTAIDPKRTVRLAFGSLGLSDDALNRGVADLAVAGLSGAPGLELVERQSLDLALRELQLSLSGLVRARDAVRAGKLLRADWFMLGTAASVNGTNSIVVRIVDARSGVIRDAGVFVRDRAPSALAADLAAFTRRCRESASKGVPRVYLAIGTFEDLSRNSRLSTFPAQVRSYLTAAYRNSEVMLLERESVITLLQEIRLDAAGLTDEGIGNPTTMQSAYWLLDGFYQSQDTTQLEVELVLSLNRMFGRRHEASFRGAPDDGLLREIKQSIDTTIRQNAGGVPFGRTSEARIQLITGKELSGLSYDNVHAMLMYGGRSQQEFARQRRNFLEAVNAFQATLLLDPTNREAKVFLAACFRTDVIYRVEEARDLYFEILNEPIEDRWSQTAREALIDSFRWEEAAAQWFQSAANRSSNPQAKEFYSAQASLNFENQITGSPEAVKQAESRLFAHVQSFENYVTNLTVQTKTFRDWSIGLDDFVKSYGTNSAAAARRLVDLMPRLKSEFPKFAPHFLAATVALQTQTNTPIIAEFQQTLHECVEHPEQFLRLEDFWNLARYRVYSWCMGNRLFSLAADVLEQRNLAAKSEIPDYHNEEKMSLAFAYLGAERWQAALGIFEGSYSNRPVRIGGAGPWGKPFIPVIAGTYAAYCREKLNLPARLDPRQFSMGSNRVCLHEESAFVPDATGLWVAISDRLIHLNFNLETNAVMPLPAHAPISCLSLGRSNLWIGTYGEGLIELDLATRKFRRYTEADGLMMEEVTQLYLHEDSLWIGYGRHGERGGVGSLDLTSRRFRSFTPSIDANKNLTTVGGPPRTGATFLSIDQNGSLWVLSFGGPLLQWHPVNNTWKTVDPPPSLDSRAPQISQVSCLANDANYWIEGVGLGQRELIFTTQSKTTGATNRTRMIVSSDEEKHVLATWQTNKDLQIKASWSRDLDPTPALRILTLADGRKRVLADPDGFPYVPHRLTLSGSDLWVGGEGYIAWVDLNKSEVRKFAYVASREIDAIEVGGGFLWAKYDGHLHRVPLASLR